IFAGSPARSTATSQDPAVALGYPWPAQHLRSCPAEICTAQTDLQPVPSKVWQAANHASPTTPALHAPGPVPVGFQHTVPDEKRGAWGKRGVGRLEHGGGG